MEGVGRVLVKEEEIEGVCVGCSGVCGLWAVGGLQCGRWAVGGLDARAVWAAVVCVSVCAAVTVCVGCSGVCVGVCLTAARPHHNQQPTAAHTHSQQPTAQTWPNQSPSRVIFFQGIGVCIH